MSNAKFDDTVGEAAMDDHVRAVAALALDKLEIKASICRCEILTFYQTLKREARSI